MDFLSIDVWSLGYNVTVTKGQLWSGEWLIFQTAEYAQLFRTYMKQTIVIV